MRAQTVHILALMGCSGLLFSAFFSGITLSSSHLAYDLNRLFLVSFLVVGVLLFIFFSEGVNRVGLFKQVFGYLILALSAVASNFFSFVDDYRVSDTLSFLSFFLLLLVAGVYVPAQKTVVLVRSVLKFFVIFLSILVSLIVLFWCLESDRISFRSLITTLGFLNINFFGHLVTISLPMVVCCILASYRAGLFLRAALLMAVLLCSWIFLFLLSIKGSIVGLLGSCVLLLFFFRGRVKGYVYLLVVSCLAAYTLCALNQFFSAGSELVSGASLVARDPTGRSMQWYEAAMMSLQVFPLGMGAESWMTHAPITTGFVYELAHGHPHNMILLWAAEYGWLAVLGVSIFFWGVLEKLKLICSKPSSDISIKDGDHLIFISLIGAAFSGLIHACVSGVLIVPASTIAIAMVLVFTQYFLNFSIDARFPECNGNNRASWSCPLKGVFLALVLALGVIQFNYMGGYYTMMSEDKERYVSHGKVMFFPRYWAHGFAPDLMGSYQVQVQK